MIACLLQTLAHFVVHYSSISSICKTKLRIALTKTHIKITLLIDTTVVLTAPPGVDDDYSY